MKKLVSVLLVLVLALGAACVSAEEGRTFTVGFDPEYAPYSYMGDDGAYTGFDLEMAQAVCAKLGWTYAEYPVNWDTKDLELNANACDCIWSGFTINGREEEYAWSVPYVNNSQVVLTRADTGIATVADLAGRPVGVEAGTSALELLDGDLSELKDSFASLSQYNSYMTAFTDLQAGAIDAITIDIGVAQYYVKTYGEEYVILDEMIAAEEYGIGFRVADTELRDQVNGALMELVADGTYETLAEKYGLSDQICLTADGAVDATTEATEGTQGEATEEAADAE